MTTIACTQGFNSAEQASTASPSSSSGASAVFSAITSSGSGVALDFSSAAKTMTVGACSSVATLQLKDGSGQPLVFQGSIGLPLVASPASVLFYSDAACNTAITMVTLQGSSASGQFYMKGSAAGSIAISANLLDLLSASQTETVQAAGIPVNTFTVTSPANGSSVSGTFQIKGAAGSQYVNVAAYDLNNAYAKVGADVAPANSAYTLSVNSANLKLVNGAANIRVMGFTTPAGQGGGTSVSVDLSVNVSVVTPPVTVPASTFTVTSPANNATVTGTFQIKGAAGSQWLNVAAYDLNNAYAKVGADVTPANNAYTLSVNAANLILVNGVASVRVTGFSTAAGQGGGTSVSVNLSLNVSGGSTTNPPPVTNPPTSTPQMAAPAGYSASQLILVDKFDQPTLSSIWAPYMTTQPAGQGVGTAAAGRWGDWIGLPYPYSSLSSPGQYDAEYFDPAQISVGNGLKITAERSTQFAGFSWKSGMLSSYPNFGFSGGYFQIRAKQPAGSGTWVGIWFLMGHSENEVDLHESGTFGGAADPSIANRLMASNFHPNGPQAIVDTGIDLSADYHVYGLEYIPGVSLKMYLDGQLKASYTSGVPTGTYWILLDLQISQNAASWHTQVNSSTPAKNVLEISEVQVYKRP